MTESEQAGLQCKATIYKRDQYRLKRGRGFRMHHSAEQCSRTVKAGDYCWQHQALSKLLGRGEDVK